jgi:hypothetical protein
MMHNFTPSGVARLNLQDEVTPGANSHRLWQIIEPVSEVDNTMSG